MYMHECRQSVYVFQNYTRLGDHSLRSYANFERFLLVVMNDDDISQFIPLGLHQWDSPLQSFIFILYYIILYIYTATINVSALGQKYHVKNEEILLESNIVSERSRWLCLYAKFSFLILPQTVQVIHNDQLICKITNYG